MQEYCARVSNWTGIPVPLFEADGGLNSKLEIGGLIPKGKGGPHHPDNYGLIYKPVNCSLRSRSAPDKVNYVGREIAEMVRDAYPEQWVNTFGDALDV